jgi:hypothetical protein
LMARQLGGGRFSQTMAALTVVCAPGLLAKGSFYTMNAFDAFFWAAAGLVVIMLLRDERPKLWIVFGILAGLGLMNKYSMGFLCAGVFAGLVLTPERKHLATRWFCAGASIATLIFLPHIIWQVANGYPSLEFMRNASQLKNAQLSIFEFTWGQLRDMNIFNAPIWILGICFFLFHQKGNRFRALGWMYLAIFLLMVATNAKVYYLSPVYPILLAGGSVYVEGLDLLKRRVWIKPVYATVMIVSTVVILPFALPVLPATTFVEYEKLLGIGPRAEERTSVGPLPQYYADQFGWEEMVGMISNAFHRLTPDEQSRCIIFVRNYGEAGAVDFFGKKYGLPEALCAHNSYWYWGPGKKTGDLAIIIGSSRTLEDNMKDLRRRYAEVELVGTTNCGMCMPYENGRLIFLCRGMNTTFQALWPTERFFI